MSVSIWTGICRGGPWDGQRYTHVFTHGVRTDAFNLQALGGVRGSYTFHLGWLTLPSIWTWGDWQ